MSRFTAPATDYYKIDSSFETIQSVNAAPDAYVYEGATQLAHLTNLPGSVASGGRDWAYQHISIGNPQTAIHVADPAELEALDLPAIGPGIEGHRLFPNRTNVSWFTELGPGRVRARIFERGVGETSASGTGATGAAVAYVLAGGRSPVTVVLDGGELEVEVGADLHVNLNGWAVSVFRGTMSDDFVEELNAIQ